MTIGEALNLEVEELRETVKAQGFPPVDEVEDLPRYSVNACTVVGREIGINLTIMLYYYWRGDNNK